MIGTVEYLSTGFLTEKTSAVSTLEHLSAGLLIKNTIYDCLSLVKGLFNKKWEF